MPVGSPWGSDPQWWGGLPGKTVSGQTWLVGTRRQEPNPGFVLGIRALVRKALPIPGKFPHL